MTRRSGTRPDRSPTITSGPWNRSACRSSRGKSACIPPTATSLAANITVTNATAPGFLTINAADAARPLASNLNYSADQTRANSAQLKLGPGGDVIVYCGQASGTAHVIIDVSGYYQ